MRALFAEIWGDPLAQKNGRAGQAQHGVDVFGTPNDRPGTVHGVQCKGKDASYGGKATVAEFDAELSKADSFCPKLTHWTFATTAPNDTSLQQHALQVSRQRALDGRFSVTAIGWETIQALMAAQTKVILQFYPEHASDLAALLEAVRALPKALEIEEIKRDLLALGSQPKRASDKLGGWSEVRFEAARDIGAALLGRPLGPGDIDACPTLPETASLLADLERAGSARLAGVAGAGKSICTLQVARDLHRRGWRVCRLEDPKIETYPEIVRGAHTLYIVDDAHLARPAFLRQLEERADHRTFVLSAHTNSDDKVALPGTIQLDAQRAVRVIADGLRAAPEATLAAVQRADDRVGDWPGQELLEQRLDHAAREAQFPWQFCFILGGGWRRASVLASSARAAGADLVLMAAAIRQIGSRDEKCSAQDLIDLVNGLLPAQRVMEASRWLVSQRIFLGQDDLRCPHQRLASVLIDQILQDQVPENRPGAAEIFRRVLADHSMPLGGIALLLHELSFGRHFGRWRRLIQRNWLDPMLERCWVAAEPLEVRQACWALNEVSGYLDDEMLVLASHQSVLIDWIAATPHGACYAIGNLLNHLNNENKPLLDQIISQVNAKKIGQAISVAEPLHACEIADLIRNMRVGQGWAWTTEYLASVDHEAMRKIVSSWPADAWLSSVSDLCEHFCELQPEFGFELIEALVPSIADRLRASPQQSFQELNDIVWNSIRLYDPLGVCVGKFAPTRRMRQVGRKICSCWSSAELAAKLSQSDQRSFQAAAGVLSFLKKASPLQFKSTVLALDWKVIESQIGSDWGRNIGDARMLLGVAYQLPEVRPAIEAMVARNEAQITSMSTYIAVLAPESALRHIAARKSIAITYSGHVDWLRGAVILAQFIERRRDLIDQLLEPHLAQIASALSRPSPSWYNEALMFLRFVIAVRPDMFEVILDQIDAAEAERGWRNALAGRESNRRPGAKDQAKQVIALLIWHAIKREDEVGDLARRLRSAYPKASVPLPETIDPIEIPDVLE